MTRRARKRRTLRRALLGSAFISAMAVMGTQLAQSAGAQTCAVAHGTVAGASAQQFETVVSAASAGNSQAMIEVGHMYRDGLGVERDLVQARAWLTFAAYKGAAVGDINKQVAACLSEDERRRADARFFALLQEEEL